MGGRRRKAAASVDQQKTACGPSFSFRTGPQAPRDVWVILKAMSRFPTSAADTWPAIACQVAATSALVLLASTAAQAQDRMVYRCPGNLYTDQISTKEAAERGCKTLEGAPVTVIQARRPEAAKPVASGAASRPAGDTRIDPAEQRARDSDARRILETELRKEEERLAQLQKDGGALDERGQPRSADRLAELKAAIARKEADVAAIKREITKLGNP